jgi:NAD dependent epimerase/dehydratase family enzyme
MSWVDREDVVDLIIEALRDPQYRGVYNATAPQPVRMAEFCATLGEEERRGAARGEGGWGCPHV